MKSGEARIAVHVAAVLFGLTGILGELIQGSAWLITAGRAAFASLSLLLFMRHLGHGIARPGRAVSVSVGLAGLLLAIHWVSFFMAVKIGGIAIATLGFASFPAFITLLEGLFFHERTRAFEWLIVAIVSVGLGLVAPSFNFRDEATTGLLWAIGSGLSFALFTLANRKAVGQWPAHALACIENAIVAALTLPWCLAEFTGLRASDWLWLFILGVVCTAFSHALLVASLSRLKARSAAIIIALEPIYAIAFAALFFAQYPSVRALLGGALIIGAILISSLDKSRAPAMRADRIDING